MSVIDRGTNEKPAASQILASVLSEALDLSGHLLYWLPDHRYSRGATSH